MPFSSSAIPEKIQALANNRRLLVSKSGLAIAVVASLFGGLVVAENHAKIIAKAVELSPG